MRPCATKYLLRHSKPSPWNDSTIFMPSCAVWLLTVVYYVTELGWELWHATVSATRHTSTAFHHFQAASSRRPKSIVPPSNITSIIDVLKICGSMTLKAQVITMIFTETLTCTAILSTDYTCVFSSDPCYKTRMNRSCVAVGLMAGDYSTGLTRNKYRHTLMLSARRFRLAALPRRMVLWLVE
jgi:hypothetical protein